MKASCKKKRTSDQRISCETVMYFVLIFDADNTLWDTNSVFHEAHVAMLEIFEAAQLLSNARHQVERVRAIDRALIQHFGRYEYGFKNLATAVAHHYYDGVDPAVAAARALEGDYRALNATLRATIEMAYQVHTDALGRVPPLLASVADILVHLRTYRQASPHIATLIFSEGHPERLEKTFTEHRIRQHDYFNEIVIELKSVEAFERVGKLGRQYLAIPDGHEVTTIVIGDSLQRDIRLGNAAGFTTIYIPGSFEGRQIPQTALDQPDFQIESIEELPSILASLGLYLPGV
jgi:putative hydrolase of the HAD superfamily